MALPIMGKNFWGSEASCDTKVADRCLIQRVGAIGEGTCSMSATEVCTGREMLCFLRPAQIVSRGCITLRRR